MALLFGKIFGNNFTRVCNYMVGTSSILTTQMINKLAQPNVQSRNKAKKSGGSCKLQNHNRKRKGKRLGPKVIMDQFVQPGQILFKQRKLQMHPGRNVSHGRDRCLYALREGFVKITQELYSDPNIETDEPYEERAFMHVLERPLVRRLICVNPETLINYPEDLNSLQTDSRFDGGMKQISPSVDQVKHYDVY